MVVALAVLAVVLVSVGQVLASQLTATTRTRNEAVAQQLLTKTLSIVRALPYADLAKGLDASDATTGTAHIKKSGSTWLFSDPEDRLTGTGEDVIHSTPGTTAPPPAPLYPHVAPATVNGTTFSVAVFPTQYETPPVNTPTHTAVAVPGVVRVTVIVSWRYASGQTSSVTGQSLVSTIGRCDETTGTTGPCKPNFTASATGGLGVVTVTAAPGSPYPIEGVSFTAVSLLLSGTSTSNSLVRTSSVRGQARATGVTVQGSTGQDEVSEVSTQASNDPATGEAPFESSSLSQSSQSVVLSGSRNSITASPSSDDSGGSVSTVSAQSAQGCASLAGVAQSTSEPCGSGTVHQASTAAITAALGSATLGTANLVTVGPQATGDADRVVSQRSGPGQAGCPSGATAGCASAAAREALGTVALGGLPGAVTAPAGWTPTKGVLAVSDYSAQATASASSGTSGTHVTSSVAVPIPGAPAPSISYWNGSGYTSASLGTSSQTISVPKVTAQDPSAPGGPVTVTVATTVSIGGATTQTSTSSACQNPCLGRRTIPSPRITVDYEVVQGSTVLCDLVITANLGAVLASASYQAAS